MHEVSILNSTTLWYSVATVLFLVLFIKAAGRPLLSLMDSEIAKVCEDLKEARRLSEEAKATLEDYQKRQRDAAKEAENIVIKAKNDAARLREEAQRDIEKMVARHEQTATDRIRLAQEEAIAEVRAYVIDEALTEARGKLKKMASAGEGDQLMSAIIDDLPKLKIVKSS